MMRFASTLMIWGNLMSAFLNLVAANVTRDPAHLVAVIINILLAAIIVRTRDTFYPKD